MRRVYAIIAGGLAIIRQSSSCPFWPCLGLQATWFGSSEDGLQGSSSLLSLVRPP